MKVGKHYDRKKSADVEGTYGTWQGIAATITALSTLLFVISQAGLIPKSSSPPPSIQPKPSVVQKPKIPKSGNCGENELIVATDEEFYTRHPERQGYPIQPREKELIREWWLIQGEVKQRKGCK